MLLGREKGRGRREEGEEVMRVGFGLVGLIIVDLDGCAQHESICKICNVLLFFCEKKKVHLVNLKELCSVAYHRDLCPVFIYVYNINHSKLLWIQILFSSVDKYLLNKKICSSERKKVHLV